MVQISMFGLVPAKYLAYTLLLLHPASRNLALFKPDSLYNLGISLYVLGFVKSYSVSPVIACNISKWELTADDPWGIVHIVQQYINRSCRPGFCFGLLRRGIREEADYALTCLHSILCSSWNVSLRARRMAAAACDHYPRPRPSSLLCCVQWDI